MSWRASRATGPGPTVHFNSHIDVVEAGEGWTVDPFGGIVRDGRVYGRGACDMKGGLAASIIAVEAFLAACPEISRRHRDLRHGRRGVRRLRRRRLSGRQRATSRSRGSTTSSSPSRSTRTASASAIAASGGRRSRPRARSRMARCRSSATAPCATWARCSHAFETELYPGARQPSRRACRSCREGARRSTMNINSIHGGQTDDFCPACPRPTCPIPAAW